MTSENQLVRRQVPVLLCWKQTAAHITEHDNRSFTVSTQLILFTARLIFTTWNDE